MSDSIYLGLKARQLEDSPAYQPISCVKLTIGGEDANGNPIVCQAGNPNSGRIIETSNPLIWDASMGNTVAQNILAAVQGYAYKPYTAEGALINPAVEIGDAVEVGDVYSVVADVETTFSPLMSATISAPVGSDIDHEYPYESSENRELMQQLQGLKTSFIVENGRIAAEISDMSTNMEGLSNRVASVEMTADSISASLSAYATTEWVNRELSSQLSITAETITSTVSETYETKTAANSKLNAAKVYTDEKIAPIEGNYTSAIEQTAKQIQATVAASEKIWDTSALSQTIQNNIAAYGYGTPPNSTASQYNGKYYLDQSSGTLYKSNGSKWAKQSTQLQTIQTTTNSAITQQANRITSTVNSVTDLGQRVTAIEQTDSDITLSVYSNQNGTTYFKLSDGSGEISSTSFDFTTDIVTVAGDLTAKNIAAEVSIISPSISGGTIESTTLKSTSIYSSTFYSPDKVTYLSMGSAWPAYGLKVANNRGQIFGVYPNGDNQYVSLLTGMYTFLSCDTENALTSPGGTWDFSACTKVIMPGGTVFQ